MIDGIGETDEKLNTLETVIGAMGLVDGKLKDTILRTAVARHEMNREIFGMTIERAIDEAKAGNDSGALSSLFKYYGTELNVEAMELIMAASGSEALVMDDGTDKNGFLARTFLRSKGNTIEGGTSEVQLNIISKNILGLPTK